MGARHFFLRHLFQRHFFPRHFYPKNRHFFGCFLSVRLSRLHFKTDPRKSRFITLQIAGSESGHFWGAEK